MESDDETSAASIPAITDESVGSAASSRLKEEYESLLKYAMVTPVDMFNHGQEEEYKLTEDQVRLYRRSNPNIRPVAQPDNTKFISVYSNESEQSDEVPVKLGKPYETLSQSAAPMQRGSTLVSLNTTEGEKLREAEIQVKVFGSLPAASTTDQYSNYTLDELDASIESEKLPEESAPKEESLQGVYDSDIVRLESQLDDWNLSLRQNILAELTQVKLRLLQQQRSRIMEEREKSNQRIAKMTRQNEELKELVANCERNLMQKDSIITNLTTSLNKQHTKEGLMRSFHAWKLRHCHEKREEFACQIASEYHRRRLITRTFHAWQSIQENKWKERVERACQNKAQEICEKLSMEYEEKIAELQRRLGHAQSELANMRADRDEFEERMKKGFMRGVCALNLEAMTMFKEQEGCKENVEPTNETSYLPSVMQPVPVQPVEQRLPHMTTAPHTVSQLHSKPVYVKMVGNSTSKPPKPQNQVIVERHTGPTHHLPVKVPLRKQRPKTQLSVKIVE